MELYARKAKNMEDLILYIVKHMVKNPDAVKVEEGEMRDDITVYNVTVAEDDKGFVIGKHCKVAKALRCIVKAAAYREGKKIKIDII